MFKTKNIDNNNSLLNYNGKFENVIKENKIIKISNEKDAYVSFSFSGTKFRFYSHTNAWRGFAKIYIDDIEIDNVDLYSENEILDILVYESDVLDYRDHTVKIQVTGDKNELAKEAKIAIYRFEIDDEKPSEEDSGDNLDLTELKSIVAELKAIIAE